MENWYPHHGRQNANKDTLDILDDVTCHLSQYDDPSPIIRSIRVGANYKYDIDVWVEIELCPGLILSVRFQWNDIHGRDPDNLSSGWDIGLLAGKGVKCHRALGIDALANDFHALRMRVRKALAAYARKGVYAALGEIVIPWTQYSWPSDPCPIEVTLSSLDGSFSPSNEVLSLQGPDDLDKQLADWFERQTARFATSTSLMAQGADETIDLLAVNAIAQFGNTPEVRQGINPRGVSTLSLTLATFVVDGHLHCRGWDKANPDFRWNGNMVTIENVDVPATILTAVVGRPITALIAHPVLSDRMIITDAASKNDHGVPRIEIEFDQPKLLYCSLSGRAWEPAEPKRGFDLE